MQPDFSGLWSARLDESAFASRAPRDLQVKILQSPGKLRAAMRAVFEGQDPQVVAFEADIAEAGAPPAPPRETGLGQAWWRDEELTIATRLEAGGRQTELRDHWSLSDGGQTLVMAHRDDLLAGQVVRFRRAL
jgi:hypothetical protein